MADFSGKKVGDIKKKYFRKELDNGQMIRFIINGKLLKDEQNVDKIKCKNKETIQAFISPRVERATNNDKEAKQGDVKLSDV